MNDVTFFLIDLVITALVLFVGWILWDIRAMLKWWFFKRTHNQNPDARSDDGKPYGSPRESVSIAPVKISDLSPRIFPTQAERDADSVNYTEWRNTITFAPTSLEVWHAACIYSRGKPLGKGFESGGPIDPKKLYRVSEEDPPSGPGHVKNPWTP